MKSEGVHQYCVGIFNYIAVAWACIILFMSAAIGMWLIGEGVIISLGFLFFAALGFLMLSIATKVAISEEAIYVSSIFSKYRILWNEVELIEVGDWVLAFHGSGNKRLIVPTKWSGQDLENAIKILNKQIHLFNIKEVHSASVDYKIHKNVKIKNA